MDTNLAFRFQCTKLKFSPPMYQVSLIERFSQYIPRNPKNNVLPLKCFLGAICPLFTMETVLSPSNPVSIRIKDIWLGITVAKQIMKVIHSILFLLSIMSVNCFFYNQGIVRNWDNSLVGLDYLSLKHAALHKKKEKVKIKRKLN